MKIEGTAVIVCEPGQIWSARNVFNFSVTAKGIHGNLSLPDGRPCPRISVKCRNLDLSGAVIVTKKDKRIAIQGGRASIQIQNTGKDIWTGTITLNPIFPHMGAEVTCTVTEADT